jgi:phospholipid/cholesterol/gamma-HCH transport system substrate-binding protein
MTRDFVVGVIFILSLVFLGALTILVRGVPSGSDDLILEVGFSDVSGLKPGEPVRIRGLRAGSIEHIYLDETRGLAVAKLRIWEHLPPRTEYSFKVMAASALGGSYLEYKPGKGELVDPQALVGTASGGLFGEVGSMLAENRDAIKSSLENLDKLLDNLQSGQGIVGGLLSNDEAKTTMLNVIKGMGTIVDDLENGRGILGSLLSDDSIQRQQFDRLLTLLDQEMQFFSSGEGTAGMIFKDAEFQEHVRTTARNVDRITTSLAGTDGIAGRVLHDKTLSQYWMDISVNLRSASEQLNETGQGPLRDLLHDRELRTRMRDAIEAIASISEAIEKGPGTLHSLINNPELYQEARETLTLLRDSTEDLREQEPVSAFFSILFAPF